MRSEGHNSKTKKPWDRALANRGHSVRAARIECLRLWSAIFAALVLAACTLTSCVRKAPEPIVILVGLDGFRWDYLEKFHPPNLTRLAREGVTAQSMIPAFPTLTFPNFYTLATGLRPENHGIIGNRMFDPEFGEQFALGSPSVKESKWWGGEPLWVTAEKTGLPTACMFWPGSEAEIGGFRPSEWRPFDSSITTVQRVDTVLEWLARPTNQRPRLITLYFEDADSAGHRHGADTPETAEAVDRIDSAIGRLTEGVRRLGLDTAVNYVFVADHGMTPVSPDRVIVLSALLNMKGIQVDFSGAVAGLRPPPDRIGEVFSALKAGENHFTAYRREDIPERLHFQHHRRIPPIVLIPEEGWLIIPQPVKTQADRDRFQRASHGFDPKYPSMGATFLAEGPAFKKDVVLPPFENIHIYNLVCDVLGLAPAANDGDDRLATQALITPR